AAGSSEVISGREAAQQAAGWPGRCQRAGFIRHRDPVDPDAFEPACSGREARCAAGQIEDALLRPATDLGGVEEHEIRRQSRRDPAAIGDAEDLCRPARELPHRLFEAEEAALAHPMAEEMQAVAGVAEEGEMR